MDCGQIVSQEILDSMINGCIRLLNLTVTVTLINVTDMKKTIAPGKHDEKKKTNSSPFGYMSDICSFVIKCSKHAALCCLTHSCSKTVYIIQKSRWTHGAWMLRGSPKCNMSSSSKHEEAPPLPVGPARRHRRGSGQPPVGLHS